GFHQPGGHKPGVGLQQGLYGSFIGQCCRRLQPPGDRVGIHVFSYQFTNALLKISSASCVPMLSISLISTACSDWDAGKSANREKVCVNPAFSARLFLNTISTLMVSRFWEATWVFCMPETVSSYAVILPVRP